MKTVLVTAFLPFGEDSVNPTQLALDRIPCVIGGAEIRKLLLPVEFGHAADIAEAELDGVSPDAVIMLGQAGGRSAVTPEAEAKNLMNAAIPDNAGYAPKEEPVVQGGEEKLFSTLPNEAIVSAISALGLPAEVSHDAGAYVCNSLLYRMLHHTGGNIPAGFIHVPFIREQVEGFPEREGKPFMELDDEIRAVTAAVKAVSERI